MHSLTVFRSCVRAHYIIKKYLYMAILLFNLLAELLCLLATVGPCRLLE